jgi:uncharacterized membrane protein YkvA (DUF1232 family)
MSDDKTQYPERARDVGALMGWLKDFFGQFRLAWELIWDGRVPLVTKLVPLLTVLYMLSPVDLIPDVALGLGQLDDLAIFLIGMRLFVDVCPPALVAEHQEETRLEMTAAPPDEEKPASSTWRIPPSAQVIDLEAEEVPDTDAATNAVTEEKPKPPNSHVW